MPVERYDEILHREDALKLGEQMYAEAGFGQWMPDQFLNYLRQPAVFAALYYTPERVALGGMVGFIAPPMFGDGPPRAKDMSLYVQPQYRGGLAAVRLVQDFEKWAKGRGADYLYLAQSTGINVERTRQWYEAMGYEVVGYLTRKALPHV